MLVFSAATFYFFDPPLIGRTDLAEYWGSAKLFVAGVNPYDESALRVIQSDPQIPLIGVRMWNPPAVLGVVAWLAFTPFPIATALWFALGIVSYVGAVIMLERWAGLRTTRTPLLLLCVLSSAPLVDALFYGQIAPLLLLGFCGALAFENTNPRRAGVCLALTLLKPHLLFLPYLMLGLRCISASKTRLLMSAFVTAALVIFVLPLFWQPQIYSMYLEAFAAPPLNWRTPTLGSLLQGLSGIDTLLVRSLPALIAAGLLLARFPGGLTLNSAAMLSWVVPLSLVAAPYGWSYDQLLLLPSTFFLVRRGREIGGFQGWWIQISPLAANLLALGISGISEMHHTIFYPVIFLLAGCLAQIRKGEGAELK